MIKKLSVKKKLLFSSGDLSTSVPMAILMFFQLYFLTDVAGLRPGLAAWTIAIGRIWDAINDPLFGLISDRIRSRFGRRRVLLLIGSIPLGISFFLMWTVPPFSAVGLTIYYAIIYIIFDTAYTLVHVGYNSLTPELTKDYDERSSLNGYRMVYAIGGSLAAVILATILGWSIPDPVFRFLLIGLVLGLLIALPPFVVISVSKQHKTQAGKEAPRIFAMLKATIRTRPFWSVMTMYLLSWTSASIMSAILVYFANYYLKVPNQANYFVLCAQAAAIFFIPLTVFLAKRFDKRISFIIGTGSWIIVLIGISLITPDRIVLAYILAGLSGLGIATAYVTPWSMIPDIIEFDEIRTGRRREGSFYSFTAFFQKLGTGLALWIMAQVLERSGYIQPLEGELFADQPASAIRAIRLFLGPVPAVLLTVAILVALGYPISRKYHQDLLSRLSEGEVREGKRP